MCPCRVDRNASFFFRASFPEVICSSECASRSSRSNPSKLRENVKSKRARQRRKKTTSFSPDVEATAAADEDDDGGDDADGTAARAVLAPPAEEEEQVRRHDEKEDLMPLLFVARTSVVRRETEREKCAKKKFFFFFPAPSIFCFLCSLLRTATSPLFLFFPTLSARGATTFFSFSFVRLFSLPLFYLHKSLPSLQLNHSPLLPAEVDEEVVGPRR